MDMLFEQLKVNTGVWVCCVQHKVFSTGDEVYFIFLSLLLSLVSVLCVHQGFLKAIYKNEVDII